MKFEKISYFYCIAINLHVLSLLQRHRVFPPAAIQSFYRYHTQSLVHSHLFWSEGDRNLYCRLRSYPHRDGLLQQKSERGVSWQISWVEDLMVLLVFV